MLLFVVAFEGDVIAYFGDRGDRACGSLPGVRRLENVGVVRLRGGRSWW